jgi:23S rRNA (adenine2503-C2)-methyltransferase
VPQPNRRPPHGRRQDRDESDHGPPSTTERLRPPVRDIEELLDAETAGRIYRQLYRDRHPVSPDVDRLLQHDDTQAVRPLVRHEVEDGRMSTKFLFALPDGSGIEAVRIRRRTGMTACVSSQVGCAFGCTFCASGRLGLQRHLRAGEIVQQVLELGPRINRVVFMGIGEPLHNYDQVLRAIRILRDRRGLGLPTSGITISTIGVPKRLRQLREEHLKVNLTISLHATTDEVRHQLIPGARSFSIDDVVGSADRWAARHNRRVTFVYLLLPGVNDTDRDADRLGGLLSPQRAHVNLMRWNPVLGGPTYQRVDDARLGRFKGRLERTGLDVVVRDTQGHDIDAACGQLWLRDVGPPGESGA